MRRCWKTRKMRLIRGRRERGGIRSVWGEGEIGREEKGSWGGEKWRLIWRYSPGVVSKSSIKKRMTPPLCLTIYFPRIPPPYPPLTLSLFFFPLSHLATSFSSCSASFSTKVCLHLCPSLLFLFFFIFFYFLHFISSSSTFSFFFSLFFLYFSSRSFPLFSSTFALLHSFWFLLLLILFSYPPPFSFCYFFLSAFSSSLPSASSFRLYLSLSSFFYSSYSPSLLHSLLFLIILFCMFLEVCSFLCIILSFAPFSPSSSSFSSPFISSSSSFAFLSPSYTFPVCFFLLFFFFLLLLSFLYTVSIFSSSSLSVFGSFFFISSSLLHFPLSLFSYFASFSFAYF